MAKIRPLDGPTLAWARAQFARYYASAKVDPPERVALREFAAFPFAAETLMRRHAAFPSAAEFRAWLPREVPRHVYYSTAYYRHPGRPTMPAKEWLGADLIFDLDADHLRGAERLGYVEQLARVKEKLRALVDDFLLGDFGLDPGDLTIVFSGGRGYHVHVREPKFQLLRSPERRELVDYLLGSGFDPADAIQDHPADSGAVAPIGRGAEDDGPARRPKVRSLAPADAGGWLGRTTRAVLQLLARWEAIGSEAAAKEVEAMGFPRAQARQIARQLVEEGEASRLRATGRFGPGSRAMSRPFWQAVVKQAAIETEGETDAPVTTDLHRLIRLPGSLHGGTGFRVLPLSREELDRFEPLRDAPLGTAERQRVTLTQSVDYPFAEPARGSSGASLELPSPTALFLVLRGEAALPS